MSLLLLALLGATPEPGLKLLTPGLMATPAEAAQAESLTEQLATELRDLDLEVMTPRDMAPLLNENLRRQLLECDDRGCPRELGESFKAGFILLGRVTRTGTKLQLTLRVVQARDGGAVGNYSEVVDDQQRVNEALKRAARKLAATIASATNGRYVPPKGRKTSER